MYDFFILPFQEYTFLRRALIGCFALSLGCAPVGVMVVLRRMSLMGDALSHSILPGVAVGYLVAGGLYLPAMSAGGFLSALVVALLAGVVSRKTVLKEDASLVGFYLISLALGSLMVSSSGRHVDLMHILFGSILAVDDTALLLMTSSASLVLVILAVIYRPLVLECFDPGYMASMSGRGGAYHALFIVLIVLCMVAAFQALGTLMALGMMMMPAICARFWARDIATMFGCSFLISMVSGYLGLLISFHWVCPSGPAIILVAGAFYVLSLFFGRYGHSQRASD